MSFASIVLSVLLGQSCPPPSSPWGPPPCAVANVPGCLPGYRAQFDERLGRMAKMLGRLIGEDVLLRLEPGNTEAREILQVLDQIERAR